MAYDLRIRSELQTGQPYPSKSNKEDPIVTNVDGSVDRYFGPTAPAGQHENWMQTALGKGRFTC